MVEVRTANQLEDLKKLLTSGGDVSIAVAYVSSAGLALIEQEMLEGFSRGQKVRFLLNLDGRVTSPEAVNKLLELSRQYGRKLESKFFFIPNAVFHPKLYMSISGNEVAFLSGSTTLLNRLSTLGKLLAMLSTAFGSGVPESIPSVSKSWKYLKTCGTIRGQ